MNKHEPHWCSNDFLFFGSKVKVIRTGKQSKMTLSVDIPHGRLYAVKPSKESLDSNNIFTHERSMTYTVLLYLKTHNHP